MNNRRCSLVGLKSGEKARIYHLPENPQIRKKLSDLGFRKGSVIEKISNMFCKGPVTIKIYQTRIALGWKLANSIIIERKINENN